MEDTMVLRIISQSGFSFLILEIEKGRRRTAANSILQKRHIVFVIASTRVTLRIKIGTIPYKGPDRKAQRVPFMDLLIDITSVSSLFKTDIYRGALRQKKGAAVPAD